jgi:phosphatidylinositol alpha-1,6-mannosyltransferase
MVVAADTPGAAEFDAESSLRVRRVAADPRLGPARNIPLNGVAVTTALRFRPQLILSIHIVTSLAAAAVSRALGAPTVQYFHAKEIGSKPRLAAFAARNSRAAIAVSAYTAGLIEATGHAPRDVSLIPPGVDLPSETERLPAEHPTLLTVARLEDRYKGHDVVLRAMPLIRAAVPDARWVVIGDGPLRPGLERLAEAQRVAEAVDFLGPVTDAERNRRLREADLLVMPSRLPDGDFTGEGFGIVYLEAGAFGKPVLAGNVGGPLDAVIDGKTGLLVDPTDHIAVADGIVRLLTDRALAARLGEAGAAHAREHAWPRICERLEAVLHEQLPG